MNAAPLTIQPALPEHEAMIRARSEATNTAHRARLPHKFAPTNAFQDQLLDMAFDPALQQASKYRSCVYMASRGDDPLGFALVIWQPPSDENDAEGTTATIADIAVFDGAQGQGVGTALLDFLETQMAAQGWRSLVADVWLGNDASHALFRKSGYVPERTEYRLGQPAALTDTPSDDAAPQPKPFNWTIAALVLLVLFIIASIP